MIPRVFGAGTTPSVEFVGAAVLATTVVGFATSPANCYQDAQRFATVSLGVASSTTVVLLTAVPTGGVYSVCYSVDDQLSWSFQANVNVTILKASDATVTDLFPDVGISLGNFFFFWFCGRRCCRLSTAGTCLAG